MDILNKNWKNLTYQLDCVHFHLLPSLLLSCKSISAWSQSWFMQISKEDRRGSVLNQRYMSCLKKTAIYSAPAVYCLAWMLAQCREIFLFSKESSKIKILCNSSHFKILATNYIKNKTTLCQPNKMLLWTNFSKGHKCGRVRPGLRTPIMLFSLLHRTLNWWGIIVIPLG